MFGIGPQELLLIGLLVLLIFGPAKASGMARDLGRFVSGAQRSVDDLKSEFYSEEVKEVRHTVEEFRDETRRSVEELKNTEVAGEKEVNEPSSDPRSEDQGGERQLKEEREPPKKEETPPPLGEKVAAAQPEPQERGQGDFDGLSVDGPESSTQGRGYTLKGRSRRGRIFGRKR